MDTNLNRHTQKSIGRWVIPFLLLIPAIVYLPGILGGIPFPSENAPYTDLLITHYPYTQYLKNSLVNYQAIPLWSNLIYSGMPFSANPLAGVFYLPGWLAMIFPLPAGISIVLTLHILFGSWGFYLFLKKEGVSDIPALLGALAFGLMPKITAHYGAGHITLIYALTWTPWLFVIGKIDRIGWTSGVTAAMLFLADPRWAFYAGILWVGYSIAHRQFTRWREGFVYFGKAGLAAFMIASPLILPLIEFSKLSTRSEMNIDDMLVFSLPVDKLLGILIPSHGGNVEWFMYSGGLILSLFLLQLADKNLRKRNLFWTICVLISVLASLGIGLSSAPWLAKMPIISLLRVPPRALFIMGFSLAFIAALSLDHILKEQLHKKQIVLTAVGIITFSILMAIGLAINIKGGGLLVYWGLGFLGINTIILILLINNQGRKYLVSLLGILLLIDLFYISINNYSVRTSGAKETDWQIFERYFLSEDELFRIYSPSYSIPQHIAAEYNIELADGVDPFQLKTYSEFMVISTNVKTTGYNVSIPPFETGHPESDNSESVPSAEYLSLIGVKYVISQYELDNSLLELLEIKTNKYIYLNRAYFGRAWIEPDDEDMDLTVIVPDNIKPASIILKRPNRIVIRGEGPGELVLSEIFYPGWSTTVDGEPTNINIAYDILRSVTLNEGEHVIVFSFNPVSVYIGLFLAGGCWIIIFLTLLRKLL
jgi:hypothetical protein